MGIIATLFGLGDSPEHRALERRLDDLEVRCRQLHDENEALHADLERLGDLDTVREELRSRNARITDLKAALSSVLILLGKQWAGAEEQAIMRTALAVLENDLRDLRPGRSK